MSLTDTHCHLDYNKFDADRAEVIQRAIDSGLIRLLVPGLHHRSSRDAVLLAESNPSVYAAVGFHPTDLEEFSESTFQQVKELAVHPKVVAIGEIGIDTLDHLGVAEIPVIAEGDFPQEEIAHGIEPIGIDQHQRVDDIA